MTEDTKAETDRVGASNGTTVVAVTTVAVVTGIVQNVKIQTSHSEPNATDAVNPKDTVEAVGEAMTAEADETTVGTKVETDKAVALNETTEVAVTTVAVATGIVQNVKIQTSHSEPNATDAVNPKDTVEAVGEAMTVEADETTVEADETTGVTEADAVEKSTTITTGIVQNARTQISHSGTNATDAENLAVVAEAVVEAMTAEVAGTIEVGAVTAVTKVRDRQGGRFERGGGGGNEDRRDGDWDCSKCQNSNFAFRTECNRCGASRGGGGGRGPRRDTRERTPQRNSGDRPPRREFSERPPRREGDRPPRRDGRDRRVERGSQNRGSYNQNRSRGDDRPAERKSREPRTFRKSRGNGPGHAHNRPPKPLTRERED